MKSNTIDEAVKSYIKNSSAITSLRINGTFYDACTADIFVIPQIKVYSQNENRFAKAMDENEMPLDRFISNNTKIVLEGGPGSGKTTLLRFLSIASQDVSLGDRFGMPDNYLPIYVSLAAFGNQNNLLLDYVSSLYKKNFGKECDFDAYLNEKLSNGKVIFLLDGLNDLSADKHTALFSHINRICEDYSTKIIFVITTRTLQQSVSFGNFKIGHINDFNVSQIEEYSNKVYSSLNLDNTKKGEIQVKFINAISKNPELFSLARTPLFLSVLVLMFLNQEELPHKRIEIFNIYLNDLVTINTNQNGQSNGFSNESIIRVLAYIAYNMTKKESQNSFASVSVLKNYIRSFFEKKAGYSKWDALQNTQTFFDCIIKRIGIFSYESESEGYAISQQSIKEYLSALNVCYDMEDFAEDGQKGRLRYKEIIDMLLPCDKWHNVLKLVFEYITTINNNICSVIDAIEYILNQRYVYSPLLDAQRLIVAGESLIGVQTDDLDTYNSCVELCRIQIQEKMYDSYLDCYIQMKMGRVLAQIGDPRLINYLTVPELIEIEPGTFEKGADYAEIYPLIIEADNVEMCDEDLWIKNYWREILLSEVAEKEKINMPSAYRISKYPITNQQYQVFLNENPTYHVPGWGDDKKGALYTWNEELRSCSAIYNNCPVVLVSWNDAQNYCMWLSEKTGRKFRLPTEEEWEYAARGPYSNIYPWGNVWKENYSNTLESKINDIVAVGCFEQGKSYFGLYDCAGQIWEWTSTEDTNLWKKAWPPHIRSSEDKKAYIVRGGAWDDISVFARCSARGPNAASFYEHYIGFRIVEEL